YHGTTSGGAHYGGYAYHGGSAYGAYGYHGGAYTTGGYAYHTGGYGAYHYGGTCTTGFGAVAVATPYAPYPVAVGVFRRRVVW
ncbi:MAG: hypothetical protein ACXWDN_16995, partial [Limisphaerales bacterium]